MANVGTFDFTKVAVNLAGFVISGFADADDAITVEPRNDAVNLITGADKESVFIMTADNSVLVTLKLLPSSASNQVLSNIVLSILNIAAIPVPLFITDLNGTTLLESLKVMPQKMANWSSGKNLSSNDWAWLCSDGTYNVGGMT